MRAFGSRISAMTRRQRQRRKRKVAIAALVIAAIAGGAAILTLFWGAQQGSLAPQWLRVPLKAPRASGEIVFLTLRGPTTTQTIPRAGKAAKDSQTGFEHDLAIEFASDLGLKPRFIVLPSYQKLLDAMRDGRGHIAAAGLTPSFELRQQFAFGPSYKIVQNQLIYRSNEARPRTMKDIAGKQISVIAETPGHDLLRELTGDFPTIGIDVLPQDADPDELLKRVESGQSDFALTDNYAFMVGKRLHPDLAMAFSVGRENKVAWAFAPQVDYELQQATMLFFEKIRNNGTLARLVDRYYGHTNRIHAVDSEEILSRMQTVLPRLRPFFHEAQQATGIDWRLLAAVGYQESHWDALATSPTGVRGLMMLTEDTADRMNVKNRLDARESILGGARYLLTLRDVVPLRIQEPDRTWLALAAYNQGYGHLEDARILTQRMKLDADAWLNVRKAYARMREPEVYESLKHGFCRGDEAIQFVENIRNYADILLKLEKPLEMDSRFDLMRDNTNFTAPKRIVPSLRPAPQTP
jgi:membrane-bound lytic murein transglycosylase F